MSGSDVKKKKTLIIPNKAVRLTYKVNENPNLHVWDLKFNLDNSFGNKRWFFSSMHPTETPNKCNYSKILQNVPLMPKLPHIYLLKWEMNADFLYDTRNNKSYVPIVYLVLCKKLPLKHCTLKTFFFKNPANYWWLLFLKDLTFVYHL